MRLRRFARGCVAAAVFACLTARSVAAAAPEGSAPATLCPGDGTVRFGVIPAEDTLIMTAVYRPLTAALSQALGCPVELAITSSYAAAVEAMRAKQLDVAGFGPLSYVLAHRLAGAQAVAEQGAADGKPLTYWASIVTYPGSGIRTLREVAGHSFAFSDPASTSGHLLPSFALKSVGIDPATGVRAFFAGSHTASFEALLHHKVDAGELNSGVVRVAQHSGAYDPAAFVTLWRSKPIPGSPLAVRGDLPDAFKVRLRRALFGLRLDAIADPKRVFAGARYVPVDDAAYDGIRAMIATLHIDLDRINE